MGRFLVAGFDALTRTFRSSSAGRRLWKVVLAWRSAPGRATRAWSKERFWLATAPRASLAFCVRAERSAAALGDRGDDARAVHEEVGEGPLVAIELLEQAIRGDERRAQVLVGLVGLRALAGVDRRGALDDVPQRLPLGTAQRVEELIEVDRAGGVGLRDDRVAPELRAVVRAGLDRDVAVGDPGEGGRADDRRGALVQRPVNGDVDLRLSVVGQLDVVDAPDGDAPDQDLVALDQLAAGLEEQAVVVGVAAARKQQDEDRDRDQHQGADRGQTGESAAPPYARALR